jgi:hypothetical protein
MADGQQQTGGSEPGTSKSGSSQRKAPVASASQKKHCRECSHYECCPRMRGENICYGMVDGTIHPPVK